MAKLIYSMITSLDGYTEDEHGRFGLGLPEDEEMHSYICELESSFGTCLYGRKMYETMVCWETTHLARVQPRFRLDFSRQRQAAEKVVYSRTLAEPRSARTKIERSFDPGAVRSRQMPRTTSRLKILNWSRKRTSTVVGRAVSRAAPRICANRRDSIHFGSTVTSIKRGSTSRRLLSLLLSWPPWPR
jgi:RibD C-terminal domain